MRENNAKKWLRRILDFLNPLRDPSLTVALVLTFLHEAGQHDAWYMVIIIALVYWAAVRGIVWLIVNFAFAVTFLARRVWWTIKHPRLAWRILDAVGHEEIVIGPTLAEGVVLQDGHALMSPALATTGLHIIGELPAGAELPMLGMPNNQMGPGFNSHYFNGMNGMISQDQAFQGFIGQQNTEEFGKIQNTPSVDEEHLREQIAAFSRLIDDWMQFTEEKWRTVSDSQLGWKPLRGRWNNWDDIFSDAYAAKTSDPMAQAAQAAADSTARRFETSKDKGSAASAVACFMRDVTTLRQGIELMQKAGILDRNTDATPQPLAQNEATPFKKQPNTTPAFNSTGFAPRSSLIRRPTQIFVDADTN